MPTDQCAAENQAQGDSYESLLGREGVVCLQIRKYQKMKGEGRMWIELHEARITSPVFSRQACRLKSCKRFAFMMSLLTLTLTTSAGAGSD